MTHLQPIRRHVLRALRFLLPMGYATEAGVAAAETPTASPPVEQPTASGPPSVSSAVPARPASPALDDEEVSSEDDDVSEPVPLESNTPTRLTPPPYPLVVHAILPRHLRRVPGASSRVTRKDIETYRPYNLHETLRRVPGVNVVDDDPLSRRGGIGVRGGAPRRSRKVLLLEDGTPINASTYLDPSAHYTPPVERLEGIEVLRGAGQIVHGPLNNHGIVNFRALRATAAPETVVSGAYDSNHGNRRHARHRRKIGDLGLVLAYTGADADGAFDTERLRWNDFYASAAYTVGRSEISVSGLYYRERSNYDETNLTRAEFDAHPRCKSCLSGDRGGAELNTFSADYGRVTFAHDARLSRRVTLSSKIHGGVLDRPRFESRRGGPTVEGGSMRGRVRTYRQAGAENRVEVSELRALGLRNDLQGGLRVEVHAFDNRNVSGRVGELLGPNRRGSARAVRGVDGYGDNGAIERYRALAYSGFVQDAVSFGDFTAVLGARLENYTQAKRTEFDGGEPIETPYESDQRLIALPGISLLYSGLSKTNLYAGVHRGYAPAIARTESFPLQPEIGVNSQLGARTRLLPSFQIEGAVFHNHLSNTLHKLTFTDVRGNNIFINSGDARILGAEAMMRIDTRALTKRALNAFAEMSYTFVDARFTTPELAGRRLPEIPRHWGSVTLGLEHAAGWDWSATLNHRAAFFTDVENTVPTSEDGELGVVGPQTLLSARANYRVPATAVTLFVSGTNLTDRLAVSDRQDGIKPILRRTVLLGLSARLD